MELNLSVPLFILKGCGKMPFPSALKREPLKSQIGCESLYLGKNERAIDEPCFIICSGSIYRSQDNEVKNNMLGMFVKKKTTNLVTFSLDFSFSAPGSENVSFYLKLGQSNLRKLWHAHKMEYLQMVCTNFIWLYLLLTVKRALVLSDPNSFFTLHV